MNRWRIPKRNEYNKKKKTANSRVENITKMKNLLIITEYRRQQEKRISELKREINRN